MEVSRHWRLRQQRYALVGEVCGHCDAKIFPPRDICPDCGQEATQTFRFSGRGEVYSFSTVRENAPEAFKNDTPYTVALIKLEEGPMVTGRITDLNPSLPVEEQVEIGMQVEMVTRKLMEEPGPDGDREKGIIVYGPVFRENRAIEGSIARERSR